MMCSKTRKAGACGARELAAGTFLGQVPRASRHEGLTASEIVHRCGSRLPAHTHAAPYFCLLVRGRYAESIGRCNFEQPPMTVVYHPPHFSHRDRIGDGGAQFFAIDLDLARFAASSRIVTGLSSAAPAVLGLESSIRAARMFARHRAGLLSGIDLDGCVWEFLGEVAKSGGAPEIRRPRWMDRCLELLADSISRNVTVADLADVLDIHPVHLSREFRRRFGRTVGEHLHLLRVRAACSSLADRHRPLSEIAMETGFADQSHFTRVFHHLVGVSPGRYRSFVI